MLLQHDNDQHKLVKQEQKHVGHLSDTDQCISALTTPKPTHSQSPHNTPTLQRTPSSTINRAKTYSPSIRDSFLHSTTDSEKKRLKQLLGHRRSKSLLHSELRYANSSDDDNINELNNTSRSLTNETIHETPQTSTQSAPTTISVSKQSTQTKSSLFDFNSFNT